MKFSEDFAVIHSYLCSDGMVKQFGKHYQIKFTNIDAALLNDFDKRFVREFNIKPHHYKEGHVSKLMIFNKSLFFDLLKFGPYDSRNWKVPFSFLTKKTAALWLRAFFDAEAWVELQEAKSRSVRVDCINKNGLQQIAELLKKFGVNSQLTVRERNYMWRLNICGKENLQKFQDKIGFLHPPKANILFNALNSYRTYDWEIPKTKSKLLKFLNENGRVRKSRGEIRLFSIKKHNILKLWKVLKACKLNSKVQGPWENSAGRKYYCLLLKEKEVRELCLKCQQRGRR